MKEASDFNTEVYKRASREQIIDDLTSYLGEYRFEVPEFDYKLSFVNGKLADPNTLEPMSVLGARAIEEKRKIGLKTTREEAELEGLSSLEQQIKDNPFGTIVWFSYPGAKEDGYGDYGFAYVGKRAPGHQLLMTAIRLEQPKISDFNSATSVLWGKNDYQSAEDFLKSPKVLDIDVEKIKEFIRSAFQIKDEANKNIFKKVSEKLHGAMEEFARIVQTGTYNERIKALFVMENMAIKLKTGLEIIIPKLKTAMKIWEFTQTPPKVAGSCPISQSNRLFGSFSPVPELSGNQEWFTCPKCNYHADGPIGNTCPGCGLTKEKFAKENPAQICA